MSKIDRDPAFRRGPSRRALLRGSALGLAALTLAGGPVAALAAPPPGAALTPQDIADLHRVEDYLNSIKTLRARFQQYSDNGGLVYGNIYLRRPGRLRVEYDPPVPVLVVADGTWASYYDSELDQLNQLPLGSTPAWFLLRDPVSLTDGITITSVKRAPGALQIEMYQTKDPDAGVVRLILADDPLELRQWYIIDSTGKQIHIGLDQASIGAELPNSLFVAPTPKHTIDRRNK
ncbi:MAG: outer membrane lipoprotein carrier protein LolA [Dongiaceae bacterium]